MSNHIMVNNFLEERFTEDVQCKQYITYGTKTVEVVATPKKVLTVRNSPDHNVNFVSLTIETDSTRDHGPQHLEIQVRANDLIKAVENATNY